MKRARSVTKQGIEPVGYARRLERGHDKGRCGAREEESSHDEIRTQAKRLAQLLKNAPIVVAHTGAGLSTAAGIPDFRGQRGVWTREEQGEPLPKYERCWDNAVPTLGHMALLGLMGSDLLHAIISQNVDGLHLKSGIPRDKLCELHGNLFMELCRECQREFKRTADVGGVGFRPTGRQCPVCGAALVDVLLDWEDELRDYDQAVELSERCRVAGGVALCLGTSLQVSPSKDLPAKASNLVIVNLQPTAKDRRAQLTIRGKIDTVMQHVMQELGIPIPMYRRTETLVVSHTCSRGKGDRWKWSIAVGDAADGARCGYVESMTLTFPGTRLIKARLISPPFRVSRTTKFAASAGLSSELSDRASNHHKESFVYSAGNKVGALVVTASSPDGAGVDALPIEKSGDTSSSKTVVESAGTPEEESTRTHGPSSDRDVPSAAESSSAPVVQSCSELARESASNSIGSMAFGETCSAVAKSALNPEPTTAGVVEGITAVIQLKFVAAPGHTAPDGVTIGYDVILSAGEGSREVPVFLGEFDYNRPEFEK